MARKLRLLLGVGLLALLLLFILLNSQQADVHFIIGRASMPQAILIILSAGLGAGAVLAFRFWKSVKREQK